MATEFDIPAIREALHDRLGEISGLFVYDFFPGTATVLPCVVIFPPEQVDYRQTPRLDLGRWQLTILIGKMSPVAQRSLEQYLSGKGDSSIIEKIYEDRTLGGVVSQIAVTGGTTGLYVIDNNSGDSILGFDLTVEITA